MGLAKLESTIFLDDLGDTYLKTIDELYYKLHNKMVWEIGHLFPTIANLNSADFYISAPAEWAGVEFHYVIGINVGGNCHVLFYRDPTVSNDGTSLPSINRYQDANPVQAAVSGIFHTPTVTDVGDLLSGSLAPGGSGIARVGGSTDAQWVLDGSATFLMRVTNVSGGAIPISINMVGHT